MTFIIALSKDLKDLCLLKHPFYQWWNNGKLKIDTLKKIITMSQLFLDISVKFIIVFVKI
jgi:pyrroloquinoline quinone (PQQ) biosynthesis protein C